MDKLIWEFENCEAEWINIRSKKLVQEFVPRLVWGARNSGGFNCGTMSGSGSQHRPSANPARTAEVFLYLAQSDFPFLPRRPMIL